MGFFWRGFQGWFMGFADRSSIAGASNVKKKWVYISNKQ